MKFLTIKAQTVYHAVRHQWKFLLLVMLAFSLFGIVSGFWYAERLAVGASGGVQSLAEVSFSELDYDDTYYQAGMEHLTKIYEDIRQYFQVLSGEKTLTEEQKELLQKYAKQLVDLDEKYLQPLRFKLSMPANIYIPIEFLRELEMDYQDKLEAVRVELIAAEAAADIIKSMDSPDVNQEKVNETYASLLQQASLYGELKKSELVYEQALDQVQNHPEQIAENSYWMESQLEIAVTEMNAFLKDFQQAADDIAKENYFNILVEPKLADGVSDADSIQVTIKHAHKASSAQENFTIILLFCVLTGICCGLYFAVYREAKKEDVASTNASTD